MCKHINKIFELRSKGFIRLRDTKEINRKWYVLSTCEKAQMTFRMHKIKRTSDTCIRDLKILPFVFPNVKSHAVLIKSSLFFNAETTLELKFVSVGNYIILILICILVPRRFECIH